MSNPIKNKKYENRSKPDGNEVDGWRVSTERLGARLEFDSPLLMEAMEMLDEFACFLSDEDIHTLSDEKILEIINS